MISDFRTLKRHEAIAAALVVSAIIASPLIYDLAVTEAGDRVGYLKRDPKLLFFLAPLCISLAVALAFAGARFISLVTRIKKPKFMSSIGGLKTHQKVAILLGFLVVAMSLIPAVVVVCFYWGIKRWLAVMCDFNLFVYPAIGILLAALMIWISFLKEGE